MWKWWLWLRNKLLEPPGYEGIRAEPADILVENLLHPTHQCSVPHRQSLRLEPLDGHKIGNSSIALKSYLKEPFPATCIPLRMMFEHSSIVQSTL